MACRAGCSIRPNWRRPIRLDDHPALSLQRLLRRRRGARGGRGKLSPRSAGLVADRRKWSLPELRAMPQADQVTRHICVEGWSAIGKWGGVPFATFCATSAPTRRRQVRRLQVRRRLLHQHRHGHRAAPADAAGADLRRPGAAAQVRLSDEAAHAHQAGLQEPQAHPGDFRHQHLPRRLLGRPGLQLVRA
jgi:hypothetical protein